jgi:hypothetical protein
LQPLSTNLFVGESCACGAAAGPISNLVENLTQLQFNGDGFAEDKLIFRKGLRCDASRAQVQAP